MAVAAEDPATAEATPRDPHRFHLMPRTVRGILIAVLIVLAIPIFVLESALHYGRLGAHRAEETQANLEVARVMSEYMGSFVGDILREEQFVGLALASGGLLDEGEARWLLTSTTAGHPSVAYYAWADPQGTVLSSSYSKVAGTNLGDRFDLEAIVAGKEWVVSDPVTAGGQRLFFIARAIHEHDTKAGGNAPSAKLAGVVVAAVDPQWLGDVLKIKRTGEGTIAILDRQGRRVFFYPENERTLQTPNEPTISPLVAKALAGEEASGGFVPAPGVPERLAGFSPIRSIGWAAGASRPAQQLTDAAVEDFLRETGLYMVFMFVAILVALGIATNLTRPLRRLREHALAIGRGEMGARVSVHRPAELATLAQAFNRMAKEIEVRQAEEQAYVVEIEEAEESLRRARDELEERVQERTAALAASEERFRSVMETAVNAIVLTNQAGNVLFWNRAASRLFGYTDKEMVGGTLAALVPERLLEEYAASAVRLLAGDRSISMGGMIEVVGRRKDGSEFPAELSVGTTVTNEGTVFTGIIRDLTRRKQADEDLRRSVATLRRVLEDTVQAMAMTVETRDPYTAGHQRRVADLASAIAAKMDLPEEQVATIRLAATIHDIGKISVPAEILVKPGRISEWEFDLIKGHPQIGYDVLKTIEFPWPIARIVHQHHERLNGSGYPGGLGGDGILLEAKIVAVADVVEAMASYRPYRPALGIHEALQEISHNSGTLYDPDAVAACLRVFDEGFKWE